VAMGIRGPWIKSLGVKFPNPLNVLSVQRHLTAVGSVLMGHNSLVSDPIFKIQESNESLKSLVSNEKRFTGCVLSVS